MHTDREAVLCCVPAGDQYTATCSTSVQCIRTYIDCCNDCSGPVFVCVSSIQGEKELQVSFFQALVLLLFDDVDKLSFADISQATNIGTYH